MVEGEQDSTHNQSRFEGVHSNGALGTSADRFQRDLQRAVGLPATYGGDRRSPRKTSPKPPTQQHNPSGWRQIGPNMWEDQESTTTKKPKPKRRH